MKLVLALGLGLAFANLAFADGMPAMSRNMNFEADGRAGVAPAGWFPVGAGYSAYTFRGGVSGNFALVVVPNPGLAVATTGRTFGGVGQCIPAAYFYGRTVLLTGAISTWNLVDGYAGLWLRVDGQGGEVLSLDNMYDRPIYGTTAWQRYGSTAAIPYNATQICYGVINTGLGNAYADDLTLTDYSF